MLLIRSKLWSIVDGTEAQPASSDVAGLTAWRLKDSKARADILLHCGENQLISLQPLTTSKLVWDRIKTIYQKSNQASQVHLHKQLCRMTMSKNDDVVSFLESWQALLQEAAISGCTFSDAQQVHLLLGSLPESWSAFVTTQGGLPDLTLITLLSNILQQNTINLSKHETPKTSAFYVKGKFTKPTNNKRSSNRFQKSSKSKFNNATQQSSSHSNPSPNSSIIICHYCGIPGHKAPDCRKKKCEQSKNTGPFQLTLRHICSLLQLIHQLFPCIGISTQVRVTTCPRTKIFFKIIILWILRESSCSEIIVHIMHLATVLYSSRYLVAKDYLYEIFYTYLVLPKI